MIHREGVGDHAAEAESGSEDSRRINAQVRLGESQQVIEQGVVFLQTGGAIGLGSDEDGGIVVGDRGADDRQ